MTDDVKKFWYARSGFRKRDLFSENSDSCQRMIEPFDPFRLTPAASLNRMRIVDLPGIDPAVKGKTGYDLVSAQALSTMIRENADSLKLPDAQTKK